MTTNATAPIPVNLVPACHDQTNAECEIFILDFGSDAGGSFMGGNNGASVIARMTNSDPSIPSLAWIFALSPKALMALMDAVKWVEDNRASIRAFGPTPKWASAAKGIISLLPIEARNQMAAKSGAPDA